MPIAKMVEQYLYRVRGRHETWMNKIVTFKIRHMTELIYIGLSFQDTVHWNTATDVLLYRRISRIPELDPTIPIK